LREILDERMEIMEKRKNERSWEQQNKDRQDKREFEQKVGYGDKKLEGPNRPADYLLDKRRRLALPRNALEDQEGSPIPLLPHSVAHRMSANVSSAAAGPKRREASAAQS
jgi:hypothetical protein